METVISAAITGAVTLAICLITNNANAKRTEALIEYRLDALTKQVEKHNNLIERMTTTELNVKEARKDVDALFDRVREVEKGAKHG